MKITRIAAAGFLANGVAWTLLSLASDFRRVHGLETFSETGAIFGTMIGAVCLAIGINLALKYLK